MLYKKELSQIPPGKMPKIETGYPHIATAQVVELKRSGKILVVDFFHKSDKKHLFRFCTDGKTYQTQSLWNGSTWTEQNPRAHIGYCATEDRPEDRKIAGVFLGHKTPYDDLMSMVDRFICRQRWDRQQKIYDRKVALRKEHFAMYPPRPDNLTEYCETHLFDAYIFIYPLDKKGTRPARCSHCGAEYDAPKAARSGQPTICPTCGKSAVYRATWIKSDIENMSEICIAAKVDGQILLRWTNVYRRFAYPDFKAKYEFDDYAYNLHLHGGKTYFYKWRVCGHYYGQWDWYRGAIGDLCDDTTAVYPDNLYEVFGERYCGVDLKQVFTQFGGKVQFAHLLDNLQKIPATEYLLKMGMTNLATSVRSIPGAMACKRPSFTGVLDVDGQLMKLYSEANVTLAEHRAIQHYGKFVSRELFDLYRGLGIPSNEVDKAENVLSRMSFSKFVHYFHKQKRLNPEQDIGHILVCYRDYIDMSEAIGVDLSHKGIRFPKNCVEAHNQILPRFNAVKHEVENRQFAEVVKAIYEGLRITAFEKDGFCIELPQTRSDLITEGQTLNHCVGGERYYKNHIAGTRLIFFVRKITNRAKPFFTMEVDMADFHICQLYGFGDCSAPPEVRKFAEAFVKKLAPAKVLRKTA